MDAEKVRDALQKNRPAQASCTFAVTAKGNQNYVVRVETSTARSGPGKFGQNIDLQYWDHDGQFTIGDDLNKYANLDDAASALWRLVVSSVQSAHKPSWVPYPTWDTLREEHCRGFLGWRS
jgi:hypothetical protein